MGWVFLSEREPFARKPHCCFLCDREINVGEKHVYRIGISSQELSCLRMHLSCEKLTRKWGEGDWLTLDPVEFRHDELGERE